MSLLDVKKLWEGGGGVGMEGLYFINCYICLSNTRYISKLVEHTEGVTLT